MSHVSSDEPPEPQSGPPLAIFQAIEATDVDSEVHEGCTIICHFFRASGTSILNSSFLY